MNIELARDPKPWDAYVNSAAQDSLYHRWFWRDVIEDTFGHQAYYLTAVEDGTIRGILPLVLIRSRLFGNSLISIPFFSYGGVIADAEPARDGLLAGAAELGRELGARHIELRQGGECGLPWAVTSPKVTMEIDLPATADEYLETLSAGRRKRIRYNLKRGFHAELAGAAAIPAFYNIFAINMRNLGTPVYPRRFFERQFRHFPDKLSIVILWEGEKAVAAGILTAHGKTLELPWAASLEEYRKKEAPMTMYWSLIEHAIRQGFRKLDLGRCTRGSGNWMFKRHWNPVERPLYWYYWMAGEASIPCLRPENPKFKLATSVWKRLPLLIANGLGPRLTRSLP
jgi:serine/alanine adding enzyme